MHRLLLSFCFFAVSSASVFDGIQEWGEETCSVINRDRTAVVTEELSLSLALQAGIVEGWFDCAGMDSNTSGLGVDESYNANYRSAAKFVAWIRESFVVVQDWILGMFSR